VTAMSVPARSDVPLEHTWNAASVFESDQAWEAEFQRVSESLIVPERFKGQLGDSPTVLADALQTCDDLMRRVGMVIVYAGLKHSVDTTNQAATGMNNMAQGLQGRALAAIAFIEPGLLAIGERTLRQWLKDEPRLAHYEHYLDNLFRKQAHVRSDEVEELLGALADPFSGVSGAAGMLTNADFKFAAARSSDDQEVSLTQGTINRILGDADRTARRTAWESYTDTYLAFKNTLASTLITSLKQSVFKMRARRHRSTLEATLFEHAIPIEVFHNLIAAFRKNLPTWHRYWALRRRALGVETLQPYDVAAPLTGEKRRVTYAQAVDWICQGLAPLGEAYVEIVRKGCLEERWVDAYPNVGKSAGAFSWGMPGTHPFIVMNFNHDMLALSTLAHELGHSMHSYLTWQNQPLVYSQYATFIAEVASNFHQALVRAYLFKTVADPIFQINLIEEAMSNFRRYFFIMPTLARFELATHERIERGAGLTADELIELLADLFSEGYGGQLQVDRARVGITWATFPHLYEDYYVFQYATGISGAHALARRVLAGEAAAVDDYLDFLKAGSSVYPLDALKRAGVNLTTPQAVEETFAVLAEMVDRLALLLDRSIVLKQQARVQPK